MNLQRILEKILTLPGPALLLYFLGTLLTGSCTGTNKEVLTPYQKKYFDLKGYFEQEIKRIETFPRVKKIATVDGVKEEQVLSKLNFAQELKIFSNADINRPAWSDKYTIDSVFNEEKHLAQLTYQTKDEGLRTKRITVDFEAGNITSIYIENKTSSAIADTEQLLTYRPSQGYSIESKQNIAMSEDNIFLVEVQFLTNL